MRILLDTNILYRWFYDPNLLSEETISIIRKAEAVCVSAASLWEIAIKVSIGKMTADPRELISWIEKTDFEELPIRFRHTRLVAELPMHHNDPFDRLLIAQSMLEPLHLLTADTQLSQYTALVIQA